MRFVLIFKIDVLAMSGEHHPPSVTLGTLQDISRTFLQKHKAIKQLTLWYFRHTFGETKLKIMQQKCICMRG